MTAIELLYELIGTPTNPFESMVLYIFGCLLTLVVIEGVIGIFRVLATWR